MNIGDRVELHPGLDDWMRGDRYGEVVKLGREQLFRPLDGGDLYAARSVHVLLDKSGRVRTYHPERVSLVEMSAADIRRVTTRTEPQV